MTVETIEMTFGMLGPRMIFSSGVESPNEKSNFLEGAIGQRNVTYREKAALRCGCSVPAAE